jgi:DNA-binding response OmpR family regulator
MHGIETSAISTPVPRTLRHECIALDVAIDIVTVDECVVHVPPIPFRILKYLLFNVGRAVSEPELMQNALQTHHDPESSAVREHIRMLRRRLGEKAGREIKTIRGAGYGIGIGEEAPRSRPRRLVSKT